MRKAIIIVVVAAILSGCSYMDYLPKLPTPEPPTATATATIYLTPTDTATITPTQPTATFTLTPTLIYPNGTPIPSLTASAAPTQGSLLTETATPPPQIVGGSGPFESILVSGQQLYWGQCEPSSIAANVKVQSGVSAGWVLIELRLQDVTTGEATSWGGGAIMQREGHGVFSYTLTAKNFEHYREFKKAWGQYQFVALDASRHRIGASTPYLSNLTIAPCP